MAVRIKICGLTRRADVQAAVAAGADYVGFVLVPESPRYVPANRLRDLLTAVPTGVETIAVVVNRSVLETVSLLEEYGFDLVQLHGDETAETASRVGTDRVWKAFALHRPQDIAAAAAFPASAVVADTMLPGQRGGTGQTGNWELAARLARQRRVVLAGGLTPENVRQAVAAVQPYAVDVSSGVESSPGCKDVDRLRRFMAAARPRHGMSVPQQSEE
jgi:phosphoribosylanthranilate isomerase